MAMVGAAVAMTVISVRWLRWTRTAARDRVLSTVRDLANSGEPGSWLPDSRLTGAMRVAMYGTSYLWERDRDIPTATSVPDEPFTAIGEHPKQTARLLLVIYGVLAMSILLAAVQLFRAFGSMMGLLSGGGG